MMYNFMFENTTRVYFGDHMDQLGETLKQYGNKVLLTYGGGSIKKNGLYDKVIDLLKAADMTVYELTGIEPNPRHTTVNKGAAICKQEGIDVILAVGGGSTIDASKAMAAATFYEGDDVWDLVTRKAPVTNALPLVTILTLAATGSEMDMGGVISNIETNEKYGLMHPSMRPRVSFLDPANTYTVPAFQTACGSVDIMAHLFDVMYFSKKPKMAMLQGMMEELLRTVYKYAPIAIAEPENYDARANLMWASSWALNDFMNTGSFEGTANHAIEHELSAFYDITHGLGLAIVIPRWMSYILDETNAQQFSDFGVNVLGLESPLNPMDGARAAIDQLSDFYFNVLGLQSSLSELEINDEHFREMARKACRGGLMKGFKDLSVEDVEKILRMCL